MQGFFYKQRIPLPCKVKHEYATSMDGDDLFHGTTFVEYLDGSQFLHIELISKVKDSYSPEERMLELAMMRTVVAPAAGANAAGMLSGMSVAGDDYYFDSTCVLFAASEDDEHKQSAKRGRGDDNYGDAASTVGTCMTIGRTRITTKTSHDQVRQQATAVLHRTEEHAPPARTVGGGLKQAPNANQHQQPASSLQHAVNHNQASSEQTNG